VAKSTKATLFVAIAAVVLSAASLIGEITRPEEMQVRLPQELIEMQKEQAKGMRILDSALRRIDYSIQKTLQHSGNQLLPKIVEKNGPRKSSRRQPRLQQPEW
jgi:hypothetical protein